MKVTKTLSVFVSLLIVVACSMVRKEEPVVNGSRIKRLYYKADSVKVMNKQGITYINDSIANGYIILLNTTNDTLALDGFLNGKKQGRCYTKYTYKHYRSVENYIKGKAEGWQRKWWENGILKYEAHFQQDVFDGRLREWNPKGVLMRENRYVNGQEEGKQRMWYDNGKLRANYMVKDGRTYGLTGTMNCSNAAEMKTVRLSK